MEEVKLNRKQIVFFVSEEEHTQIKIVAAKRNITMSKWMHRAIAQKLQKELQDEDGFHKN
jgi:hypothetical protein